MPVGNGIVVCILSTGNFHPASSSLPWPVSPLTPAVPVSPFGPFRLASCSGVKS